jgi:proteinaceous RNase P
MTDPQHMRAELIRACLYYADATVSPEGKCSSCARTLPSIDVGDLLMQRLADQVQELATSNDSRRAQWGRFVKWMGDCSRSKYDIIIDGANVGYYKKVYSRSSLADLQQINWVVEHYEAQGKRPLVIIHSRHLQALSGANASILKTWRKKAIVYSVEPKNNDDWYWMWAAVRIGGRVLVLTNDEMRDHHFQMLSHRSFLRWKERHQVRFSFGQWASGRRQVVVSEPSVYSKRTQCASDEANGDCWHIPLEDSDAWLCASQRKG